MRLIMLFFLLLVVACQEKPAILINAAHITEIENLKTDPERSNYLQALWEEDQGLRQGQGNEVLTKFGRDSKEYKAYRKDCGAKDQSVFQRIKKYLEIQGYPEHPENYDELAINAFPIIIGHRHNYQDQKELLPYLYRAYQNKKCTLGDVVWVMHEMYESKNKGNHYQMSTDRYTTEQEFKELNKKLGLGLN